jgi:hypothetical protein
MMLVENQTGTTMRLIGNLIERLNRWIAMYKMALDYEERATPTIRRNKMERPNDWRPQATVV